MNTQVVAPTKSQVTQKWEDWDAAFYRWLTFPTDKNEQNADDRLHDAQQAQQAYDEHELELQRARWQQHCPHDHVVQQTVGGMYYGGLGLIDTTEAIHQCLDCGKEWDEETKQTDEIPY